jgi:CO/xanthine dehydrogenase Mo-binding subunit
MPHAVRAQLAELFHLPLPSVRVIVPTLGGGYGGKGSLRLEPITCFLALKSGKPVKLALRRDEEFLTVTRHAATVRMKTGVSHDGELRARQISCLYNTGAYADVGPVVARNGGLAMAGPYRIPNVAIDSYAVWTNLVPAGAFRGFGVPQGTWAYESQMDMIADRLGIDPVELRRRNLLRAGDRFATGELLDDLHYERLLADVAARPRRRDAEPADARSEPATARRGRGIACVIKSTITPSTSTAAAKLNEDGSLNVLTSSVEMGQGAKTALAQIAADAADLPLELVSLSEPDTDTTPYDQQTSSSRTTYSMGQAVTRAVLAIKQELLALAADQLEVDQEDVVARAGRVEVRGAAGQSLSYGDVVRRARRGNLLGQGVSVTEGGLDPVDGQGVGSVHWHQGAAACEVAVDCETGQITVLSCRAAVYAGRAVNPRLCELQTEGSALFGLGQALFEELVYEYGRLVNPNLADYMIPSFADTPATTEASILESPGCTELHGIGETTLPPIMPALANAVFDAVGVRITDLPITPEKVLQALANQRRESGTSSVTTIL